MTLILNTKFKLLNRVEKGNFDNKTKQLIREIIGEADNAEQSLAKIDQMENEILSLSDEELLKRTQNAEKAANIAPASNANANKAQTQSTKATKTPEQMQGEYAEIKKLSERDLASLEVDERILQAEIQQLKKHELITPFTDEKLLNPKLRSETDEKMYMDYLKAKKAKEAKIEAKQKELEKIQRAIYRHGRRKAL